MAQRCMRRHRKLQRYPAMVQFLLEMGSDVILRDGFYGNELHMAVFKLQGRSSIRDGYLALGGRC